MNTTYSHIKLDEDLDYQHPQNMCSFFNIGLKLQHKASRLTIMGKQCPLHQIYYSHSKCLWVWVFCRSHQIPCIYLLVMLWAFDSILLWARSFLTLLSPFERFRKLVNTTMVVFQSWSSFSCCEFLILWMICVVKS